MKGFLDNRRYRKLSHVAGLNMLSLQVLVGRTPWLCLTLRARSAARASELKLPFRYAHHLLREAVCFLLVFVCRLRHGWISHGSLQLQDRLYLMALP